MHRSVSFLSYVILLTQVCVAQHEDPLEQCCQLCLFAVEETFVKIFTLSSFVRSQFEETALPRPIFGNFVLQCSIGLADLKMLREVAVTCPDGPCCFC